MKGKSYLLAALALGGLGTMTGCDVGLLPPNITYVEKLAKIEKERLDAHDKNITGQHKIQTPKLAAELDAQRTLFTQRMRELDKEMAAARAEQDKAYQDIIDNGAAIAKGALQIAGVPSAVTDLLTPKIEEAQDEAAEAMRAATMVGTSLTDVKDKFKDELASLREQLKDNKLAAQLSDGDLQDLKSAVEARRGEIEAALNDPAKLRSTVMTVAREAGLDPRTIQALERAGDDDLLSMILTLLGGGALGTAASRFGPSRSQKETDELRRRLELGLAGGSVGTGGAPRVGVTSPPV